MNAKLSPRVVLVAFLAVLLAAPLFLSPFSVTLLVLWTAFLLAFWAFGIPLGVGASYVYPAP